MEGNYFMDLEDPLERYGGFDSDDDIFGEFWLDRSQPKKTLDQYSSAERQAVKEKCMKLSKEDPWSYKMRKANESAVKMAREKDKEVQKANQELPPVKKASQEFKIALQQARMAANLKQKDVASKMKVTANVVSDWEAGKSVPSGSQRAALNKILRTTLPK